MAAIEARIPPPKGVGAGRVMSPECELGVRREAGEVPRLNDRVRSRAEKGERDHPGDAGFIEILEDTLTYLETVPERFSFTYRHHESPPQEATADEFLYLVLHGIRCWLGFVFYSTAYKVRHLVNDIATGLNEGDYIRCCMAARSLVEHSAVLNETYTEVAAHTEIFSEPLGTLDADFQALTEVLQISLKYAQATRFNWMAGLRGDLDTFYTSPDAESPATHIMTLVGKLPQQEKGSALWFYKMLCDFVHPNGASHMLCADAVDHIDDDTFSYVFEYQPLSDEALGVVLHLISIPVRHSLGLIHVQLAALQGIHRVIEKLID